MSRGASMGTTSMLSSGEDDVDGEDDGVEVDNDDDHHKHSDAQGAPGEPERDKSQR